MLSILIPGIQRQLIIFRSIHGHLITFEHYKTSSVVTIILKQSDLLQYPELWKLLCELADKLDVLKHPFVSDSGRRPTTSMQIIRFENRIVFDFFSNDPGNNMFIHSIKFKKPGHSGHQKNVDNLPPHLNQDEFYAGLNDVLSKIETLKHEIEIGQPQKIVELV